MINSKITCCGFLVIKENNNKIIKPTDYRLSLEISRSAAGRPHGLRGLHQGAVYGQQDGKDRRAGHFRGSRTVEGCEDVKGVYAF